MHQQHDLRRVSGWRKGAALSSTVALDRASAKPVHEQIRIALTRHSVRVIDLFRDWDQECARAPNTRRARAQVIGRVSATHVRTYTFTQ